MAFQKVPRSCKIQPGWRLATVGEVQKSLDSIKRTNLLNEFERARLLDGWIEGSSDDLQPIVGFRTCLGYMLLVECPNREVCGSGNQYSDVNLDEEGMTAAFTLCCEDWNYEVVYWLLNRWSIDENQKFGLTGDAGSLTDMMVKASEQVSRVAMALHRTRPMKRVPKTDFTRSSMISMVSDILKSFHETKEDIESLEALYWETLGKNMGGQSWDQLGLTKDLARFEKFGFNTVDDWDEIADIVWHVAANCLAVITVIFFISDHIEIDQRDSTSQKMDDLAFVNSMMLYTREFIFEYFHVPGSRLWTSVEKAAKRAKGSCKFFKRLLHKDGYGTFRNDVKYGILNAVLVAASKRGDPSFVERLLEYGVKPTETGDYENKTALHHAVIGGHRKVCELLLKFHSDISTKDDYGKTPLHYALERGAQNPEVVTVLISGYRDNLSDTEDDTREKSMRRAIPVDEKDSNGYTPLDHAIEDQDYNVRMVARLLSESDKPEAYFQKLALAPYLRESALNGYATLVKKLLESGADPLERDSEGRTALHYAAEGQNEDRVIKIFKYLVQFDDDGHMKKPELVRACDKYGRNVLHVAAFVGHEHFCASLLSLEDKGLKLDSNDRDDQSAIYYAVAGYHDNDLVLDVLLGAAYGQGSSKVRTKDSSGTTPLHTAAERGNYKMVAKLLSKRVISKSEDRQSYVRTADVLGQTALHKAVSGGHLNVVRKLLEEGAHPVEERDCDGKTALHHAVQAENEEDAMEIVELLLSKCDDKEKALLLYASAVGIGNAEESLESKPRLKQLILDQKNKIAEGTILVRLAAESGNIDMTRELLTRGASLADIRGDDWFRDFTEDRKHNVRQVRNQIANMSEQGTDKPTLLDNLGRSAFADGLAALFLNPFVKSPITVGISGEWGMGKSSVMIQTECILLKTAAQLAFIDLLQIDDFPGSRKSKSSEKCKVKNERLRKSIERMLSSKKDVKIWDFLSNYQAKDHAIFKSLAVMDHRDTGHAGIWDFLSNFHAKYHATFKSLAVIDSRDTVDNKKEAKSTQIDVKSDGKIPSITTVENKKEEESREEDVTSEDKVLSILTVRYNAWNYRNEAEAWAGLAVEITKELESTMTVAQWLSTSWKYTWAYRRRSICVDVILPCCFAIILAIWATVILWLVLDRVKDPKVKNVKYGSFPLTLIAVIWAVVKSIMSVVKPISSQMLDYMSLPDHSQKLGYHHKVENDINFLKNEVGGKPFWLWNGLAFIWCCATFCFRDNYIPHTTISKTVAASKDNLRMIVFVDDLDRCQENVVLQIMSAANLVLAACDINVVLGMDKSMIERAIIKMYGDNSIKPDKTSQDIADKANRDVADKYLRKIIQLPLDLHDPSDLDSLRFLEEQLGELPTGKEASHSGGGTRTAN